MVAIEVGKQLVSGPVLKVQWTGFADSVDAESTRVKNGKEKEESRMTEECLA